MSPVFVKVWSLFLICEHPCGLLASLRSETKSGRVMANESVGLPMRDNSGAANLIYYQSNMIDVEEFREPGEDEILKIDVVDETYFEHLRFALGFSLRLFGAGSAALIHALVPCLFEKTASRIVARLFERTKNRGPEA